MLKNFTSTSHKKIPYSKNFSKKLIKIDYQQLINPNLNINEEIHNAFGRSGLGLIIIKNIPNYFETRSKILKQGFELANMPEKYLKTLEKPEAHHMVGWGKGKSFTENEFEYLCGQFYARPLNDGLVLLEDPEFEKNYQNIWPDESTNILLKNFKKNFCEMGGIYINCQKKLLPHLDKYIKKTFSGYKENLLTDTFSGVNKQDCISRLISYYPPSSLDKNILLKKGDAVKKNWCGWHRDFGILTAISHAMYFNKKGEVVENIKSGLLVKDRDCILHDVRFEENEIAIQTGDVSFILSGGTVIATPHAVKISDGIPEDVFRETIVNFFEPSYNYKLYLPENTTEKEIFEKDPFNLADIFTKFKQGCTYKEFILSAMQNYMPVEEKI